jgi:hypothetical protein
MPDGRFPPSNIQPHLASISVRTSDLHPDTLSNGGWDEAQVTSDAYETEFFFTPSTITFPSEDEKLNEMNLIALPNLSEIDSNFDVNANANWIASVLVQHGDIEVFRAPGFPDDGTAQLISQWTVPHVGPITIAVTDRKGWPSRTIILTNSESEIAIINTSRGLPPKSQSGDHFSLYSQLSSVPVTLRKPASVSVGIPPLPSRHPTFRAPIPASDELGCSNVVDPHPLAGFP